MVLKGYKYRIYPTEEQRTYLNRNMGAARFIYNWALDMRKKDFERQKLEGIKKPKSLNIFEISKRLTLFKKEEGVKWLIECSSVSLNAALRNLDEAYKNFFRRVKEGGKGKGKKVMGFPKFKKRSGDQSFQFHQSYQVDFEKNLLHIPKCPNIPAIFHRRFEGKMKTATISRDGAYRFYISILVESNEVYPEIPIDIGNVIGIDHGIRNYITLSDGKTWDNPELEKKVSKRLARLARSVSKKSQLVKIARRPEG